MASGAIKIRRVPLLAIAFLSMAGGAWLGLLRIGWAVPLPWPDQLVGHGPLMVCGFLGTLIGLERAVALGKAWGYAAPMLSAAGAIAILVTPSGWILAGALAITAASVIVVAVFVAVLIRQRALFLVTMAVGAAAWAIGNVEWSAGAAVYRVVFFWMAFLVLTIAGERLELNRVLRPTLLVRSAFAGFVALVVGGVIVATWRPETGVRLLGAGLVALTGWLARNDVARRTVRQRGLTRYMAFCLLAGYAWLGIGGALASATGVSTPGPLYDATLHAVFLGFVMSMVFAHAPVILPAVVGVALPYRPIFYAHAVVLHVSVALRVAGDLVEALARWRAWGGLLNGVALLLFVLNTAGAVFAARTRSLPSLQAQ